MTDPTIAATIANYRGYADEERLAAALAREYAATYPTTSETCLAEAVYREARAANADAIADALEAPQEPAMHDAIAAALATRLAAFGLDVDDLGDGVVDCGQGAAPDSEVRIVVSVDSPHLVCVATVYYEVDEEDGTHPVDDDEHGSFAPADVYGIAAAVSAAKGIA